MANRRLLLVAFGAFVVRALVLAALHDHPLLQPTGGLDGEVYAGLARDVASGDVLLRGHPEPFFVSPLYAYFLAAVFLVTGGSLHAAQAAQILLGAVAVWLVGDSARRLFGERAALPAAGLLALAGVVAFHEAVILQASIDPFLTALTLGLLTRALESDARKRFLLAGLALGAFALNRPNVLPWAGVVVLLLLVARGLRAGSRPAAAFALGTLLGVVPATIRNLVVSGEPVVISSHGGLNLLVGNGPGARGVYRWLDGITPNIAGQAADARLLAEAEAGRKLTTREVSAWFGRKAFAWASAEPGAAARLLAKKVWLTLSGDEAPLNFSVPWYRDAFPALRLLAVGPGLLVPLGGAGLALGLAGFARPRSRAFLVWASFVPAYVLCVALFFVSTRYRLPLLVALATAAGGALPLLVDAVRDRDRRRLALAGAVAIPLAFAALWPTGIDDGRRSEEAEWILHLVSDGRAVEARARADRLAKVDAQPGVLRFRVGQALLSAGDADGAIAELEKARAIDPGTKEIAVVLSKAREVRGLSRAAAGDLAGARPDLEAAVSLDAQNASARLNLAAVLAEKGEFSRARTLANEALVLQPGYEKALALLAALDRRK